MIKSIRAAAKDDFGLIWPIIKDVVSTGDTYPYSPQITQDDAYELWMPPHKQTYLVEIDGHCVGTYYIKPNQPGLGSHIANGGYMIHPAYRGKGLGYELVIHSLTEAKKLGYLAMQFNIVVSTNKISINLYKKLGFKVIGTTPHGFKHQRLGLVDSYIMHRFL